MQRIMVLVLLHLIVSSTGYSDTRLHCSSAAAQHQTSHITPIASLRKVCDCASKKGCVHGFKACVLVPVRLKGKVDFNMDVCESGHRVQGALWK